ncbi:hypothetical protein P22_1100 [Propionispora sp. 2/2-37]|uniref:bifunctional diguanylate cyclase/phosphodiesterase n=1 Tax=Propionispora sp. 2/2-37 TaxID=1677858 RepID=UPI0006BB86B6|nr:bifunctional diguanylate cyclase/phosphodiesterase [Propionispora sp. 2/2-37]CUH95031.1 hypothetical protein P22_1100 [Propionispora sp. 2/2-37]
MKSFIKSMKEKQTLLILIFLYITLFIFWDFFWQDDDWTRALGSVALAVSSSLITLYFLFRTYKETSSGKLFWLFLFFGILSLAAAKTISGYYRFILDVQSSFLGWDDFFYVLYPIFILSAFISIVWRQRGAYNCFKLIFDIILFMIVLFSITWRYVGNHFVFDSAVEVVIYRYYSIYPVLDFGLLCGIIKFYSRSQWFGQSVLNLLILCWSLFFIADTAYLYQKLQGIVYPDVWFHALWGIGKLVLALSGILHREDIVKHHKKPTLAGKLQSYDLQLFVTYSLVVISLLLLFTELDEINSLAIGVLCCVILMSIRQIFSFLDHKELLKTLKEKNNKLEDMVYTDYLTSMPNRFRLLQDLRHLKKPCVVIINIENFRAINEFYGYQAGDQVLKDFAQCVVREALPYGYSVYRLSGDEYALLADGLEEEDCQKRILAIYEELEKTGFEIHGQEHHLFATFGIAMTADKPMEKAQMALRYARQCNFRVQMYRDELPIKNSHYDNLHWVKEVQEAVQEDRITLYYQPIMDLNTGKVTKYEALMRMVSRTGEIIAPGCFLPIIKKTKIYPRLTEVVLKKSFAFFADKDVEFSINLSAADISDGQVTALIMQLLQGSGLAERVTFEFVESEEFEDIRELASFIQSVKAYRAKIAIDDFGSGYSNFAHILTMDTDYIKLDGSLIKEIATNPSVLAIVESIVYLARKLNIKVIAEFVSSEAIFSTAQKIGLDEVQGYFIGAPKPDLL